MLHMFCCCVLYSNIQYVNNKWFGYAHSHSILSIFTEHSGIAAALPVSSLGLVHQRDSMRSVTAVVVFQNHLS